jgi:hypothetical protein
VVSTSPGQGNLARLVQTFNTYDYTITANISSPAGSGENGVVARAPGTGIAFYANFYEAVIDTTQGGSVELWRKNDSIWTHLGSAPVPISPDVYYPLKFVVTGTNPVHLEVWLSGTQKIVFDDFSAGRHQTGYTGLVTWDSGTKWNDFDVMPSLQQPSPPPAPPTTSPFVDDFNRTSGIGLGTNYIVGYGSFTTNGTRAVGGQDMGNGIWTRTLATVGSNNYAVSAYMSIPFGSYDSGVMARSPEPDSVSMNTYTAWITTSGGGAVRLSRYKDWGELVLSNIPTPITAGTFYTLKLVATGTSPVHLEVWLDGVKKIDYNDSSGDRVTSGNAGIFSYVPAGGVQWEWFRIDAL